MNLSTLLRDLAGALAPMLAALVGGLALYLGWRLFLSGLLWALRNLTSRRSQARALRKLKSVYSASWERQQAAAELVRIGPPAVEPLLALFNAKAGGGRIEAAATLEQLGDPRAVEPLVAALKDDPVSEVRWAAAKALSHMGAPAVEPLLAVLQDCSVNTRRAVVAVLGQLGDPRAVESLVAALQSAAGGLRRAVVAALGQLGDLRAIEPLVRALQDADLDVRAVAAAALETLGWQPGRHNSRNAYYALRAVARREWEQAARFGAAAVEPLVATLQHGDPDWRVAAGAAAALGQLGDARAVEPLVAALQHPHVNVEQAVVAALEQLGDPRAVEPLVAALQDRGVPIRQAAAGALGQLGDARAVEPLVLALQDADEGVRQAAAGALGQLGDARAVEPLVVAAARGSRAAAEALRRLGPAAVEPLLERLKDQNRDNDARQHAAAALGQIGDARAVEPLVAALEDADPDVRWAVAKALETLGWQPVDKTHRARHAVALRDWATAVALGAAAVAPLVTALQGGWHRDVVMAAAHALGTIGDGRAVEPLVEWLQAWGTDKRVAAAEALGQLGDARAVEPLLVVVKAEDGATHKNSPSRVAATAMRALQQVLERSAARVAPQALHDLSRLTNLVQIVYQYDSCDNKTGEDRREVDCTRVRQLARQELSRRQHAQPWRP